MLEELRFRSRGEAVLVNTDTVSSARVERLHVAGQYSRADRQLALGQHNTGCVLYLASDRVRFAMQ